MPQRQPKLFVVTQLVGFSYMLLIHQGLFDFLLNYFFNDRIQYLGPL